MKILLPTLDSPMSLQGGVEWYAHRLAVALQSRGHEVRIVARRPKERDAQLEREVPYRFVPVPRLPGPPTHRDRLLFQGLFDRGVRKEAPWADVVHGQNVDGAGALGLKPVVATVHTTPLDEWESSRLGGWRETLYQRPIERARERRWRAAVSRFALCWSPAEHVAESLRALGAPRIELLPNPVPPLARFERGEARRRLGWPQDRRVVLYLGRLASVKRVDRLLDALHALPDATAVIAGDGPEAAALRSAAAEPGLSGRVWFEGRVEEGRKALLLSAADAFCLPSDHEGQPLAILEAMSVGLPVVATDAAWVPDELRGYGLWGTDLPRLLREAFERGRTPAPVPDYDALARRVEAGYEEARGTHPKTT